jgi:hypothetical protein
VGQEQLYERWHVVTDGNVQSCPASTCNQILIEQSFNTLSKKKKKIHREWNSKETHESDIRAALQKQCSDVAVALAGSENQRSGPVGFARVYLRNRHGQHHNTQKQPQP